MPKAVRPISPAVYGALTGALKSNLRHANETGSRYFPAVMFPGE
ncbi:hypothetical protein ACFU6R_05740 [Streptomyces sp. NPDC057499]